MRLLLINLGSFSSGTNLKVTFDSFNNPQAGSLTGLLPIDLELRYHDMTNIREYTKKIPSIFVIDATITNSAISTTRASSSTSILYGASVRQ